MTDEFVIHGIDSEYDYNYISQNRGEIIETLEKAYFNLVKQKLKFSEVNEKSLKLYVTNKKEKKANPSFTRMRTDQLTDLVSIKKDGQPSLIKAYTTSKKNVS